MAIRRSFAELTVSAFAPSPFYKTLGRPHLEYALQACSLNLFADADCLGQIQRLATRLIKGFPQTTIWGTTTTAGPALLTQASPPRRPHSRIQNVFWRIRPGPQPLFIPTLQPGLSGNPFKALQGPSRRLRRKSSFSIRVVKYWNWLPTPIVTATSVISFKRQLEST